jgi:predicted GIY-YIG superfamily endonuclease
MPRVGTVYLLHFSKPYYHARHYVGFTQNLDGRMKRHRCGKGSPLVEAAVRAGIKIFLARRWDNVTGAFERRVHDRHGKTKSICPICRGPKAYRRCNPRLDPVTGIGV